MRILVWLVVHNKLLTVDNLGKRDISGRSAYVFCNNHRETSLHLFVHCPVVKLIWGFCRNCLSVKGRLSSPLLVVCLEEGESEKENRMLRDMVMMDLAWVIRTEHTNIIFNH